MSDLKNLVREYVHFNLWANQLIVDWLSDKNLSIFKKETASSFNTIDATLQHISMAQNFWNKFVSGKDISSFDWGYVTNNPAQSIKEIIDSSHKLIKTLESYTHEKLGEKLSFKSSWIENNFPRYKYIMHAVNHSTYHRGQLITMARSLGINKNVPSADFLFYNPTEHV